MGTLITTSVHGGAVATESQMAWHLAALLLSSGHPTRLAELASRCTLFSASPELVEFLCSIPDSPISLTSDLYVILSPVALVAVGRFISQSNLIGSSLSSRVRIRGYNTANWWKDFDLMRMGFRKRKLSVFSDFGFFPVAKRMAISDSRGVYELEQIRSLSTKRICSGSPGISFQSSDDITKNMDFELSDISVLKSQLFVKSFGTYLTFESDKFDGVDGKIDVNESVPGKVNEKIIEPEADIEPVSPSCLLENLVQFKEVKVEETAFRSITNVSSRFEDYESVNMSPLEGGKVNGTCEVMANRVSGNEKMMECKKTQCLISSGSMKATESLIQPLKTAVLHMPPKGDQRSISNENSNQVKELKGKSTAVDAEKMSISADLPAVQPCPLSCYKSKATHNVEVASNLQGLCKISHYNKNFDPRKEKQHLKRDHSSLIKAQKKNSTRMHIKGRKGAAPCLEDQREPKELPIFESYVVEEEEGSGGYGIVYKARRKNDGATVAIKCPHAKAHGQHIINELKMLERFGGKNFIIKYEGSFKNGNTDCFVLEHIEHDRPEVLRKDIEISQIQWYGYCLFRALASLHKQGVMHRDVKPGNFLFSRKLKKGYLIDFNLAKDLHHARLATAKDIALTKSRKLLNVSSQEVAANQQIRKGSKSTLDLKNKRKTMNQSKTKNDKGGGNITKSLGADGSGVTSAKDVTSTKGSLTERLREPLPCQGRKELINLLQEALIGPNQEASSIPAAMRKRVAAPRGNVENKLLYITPMPLYSAGIDVTGAGLLKGKGTGKHMTEGPCVGTKGFRAPEVCFKSPHQGPKVDIWSAGVSLLYLIIGRAPFTGDPEQNLKDIAKLRGSEDLWEVAKLHNRESAFPMDLHDIRSLPSIRLRDWCRMNTKRPEFLEVIPFSFFDLLDKCLTVNPRLRISAEEALKHEFFAPCHESLRKQRLCKQEFNLDS